jgi:membrane-associated phospholipid phosphatase
MWDIDYLLFLQRIREALGPFVEEIMYLVTRFSLPAVIGYILYLFWCTDRKQGYRLLTGVMGGHLFNECLKLTFCVPRPWVRDTRVRPSAKVKKGATGYSFPSGHTTVAGCTYGFLGMQSQGRKRIICLTMWFLVGFTRNYLGVHTPQDVLTAVLEAVVFYHIVGKIFAQTEKKELRDTHLLGILTAIIIVFLLYITYKSYPPAVYNGIAASDPVEMKHDGFKAAGAAFGFLYGWFIEHRYIRFATGAEHKRDWVRYLVGAAVSGTVWGLGELMGRTAMNYSAVCFIQYAFLTFAASAVVPYLFKFTDKPETREAQS